MTLTPGLCSVTLRSAPWHEVLVAAAAAGLTAIEWGADVHVPPGDQNRAADVRALMDGQGTRSPSYGTYFRAGASRQQDTGALLSTAQSLGCHRVRVWAGESGSGEADPRTRRRVSADLQNLADRAAALGMDVGLEYHGGTLTDSVASTLALLDEVDRPNVATYWQPPVGMSTAQSLAELAVLIERVCAVHAFSWWPGTERHNLSAREDLWRGALEIFAGSTRDYDILLEFLPKDDQSLLAREAAQLRHWIDAG